MVLSGGSFSESPLSLQAVDEIKSFFPGDRCADYLLGLAGTARSSDMAAAKAARWWRAQFFDPANYPDAVRQLMAEVRLPSPANPMFTRGVVFDSDWVPTTRTDLKLPLDFDDPVHGVFSVYSDASTDAAWMAMLVRPNQYLGAGHHHSDAGMFHFSGLGINWFTETPFAKSYDGKYHNQVLVDGESMPGKFPARAAYLGATVGPEGSSAAADLTYAYSWRWNTQPEMVWDTATQSQGWELEPAPDILRFFAGTGRYKMRPWWPCYNTSNFMPTARAPFNPMQFVYRSVALVRGAHPYGIVADDLKKDDSEHLYQWTATLAPGVWRADLAGLEANQVALAWRSVAKKPIESAHGEKLPILPDPWEPLLVVTVIDPAGSGDPTHPLIQAESVPAPAEGFNEIKGYDRLTVNVRAKSTAFRILLTPFRVGDPLPSVRREGSDGRRFAERKRDLADEINLKTATPPTRSMAPI